MHTTVEIACEAAVAHAAPTMPPAKLCDKAIVQYDIDRYRRDQRHQRYVHPPDGAQQRTVEIIEERCGQTDENDLSTPERRGRENGQQYARTLRCRLYPSHLYAHDKANAAKCCGEDGRLHGTNHVGNKSAKEHRKG